MKNPEIKYNEKMLQIFKSKDPYIESKNRQEKTDVYHQLCIWNYGENNQYKYVLEGYTSISTTYFIALVSPKKTRYRIESFDEAYNHFIQQVERDKLRKML